MLLMWKSYSLLHDWTFAEVIITVNSVLNCPCRYKWTRRLRSAWRPLRPTAPSFTRPRWPPIHTFSISIKIYINLTLSWAISFQPSSPPSITFFISTQTLTPVWFFLYFHSKQRTTPCLSLSIPQTCLCILIFLFFFTRRFYNSNSDIAGKCFNLSNFLPLRNLCHCNSHDLILLRDRIILLCERSVRLLCASSRFSLPFFSILLPCATPKPIHTSSISCLLCCFPLAFTSLTPFPSLTNWSLLFSSLPFSLPVSFLPPSFSPCCVSPSSFISSSLHHLSPWQFLPLLPRPPPHDLPSPPRSRLISMPPPVFPLPFPSTYPLSFVFLSLLSSIPFPLFYHPASSSLSQFHYLIGMAVCHEHFLTAVCKVSPPNKCLYLLTPPTLPLSPPGWSNSCLVVCLILIHFKPVEKPQQHSQEWVVWDS